MPTSTPALARALADRYRVERETGQGGMATVYLARDLRHDAANTIHDSDLAPRDLRRPRHGIRDGRCAERFVVRQPTAEDALTFVQHWPALLSH